MKRAAPLSFPLVAPHLLLAEAIRLWRTTDTTAKRWAAEHGVSFAVPTFDNGAKLQRPRPADFTAATVRGMGLLQVKARWSCGTSAARRWMEEVGITPPAIVRRGSRVKPAPTSEPRPISILHQPHPHRVSTPKDAMKAAAPRSNLPDAPCFRCGARGWCGHDGRIQAWAA